MEAWHICVCILHYTIRYLATNCFLLRKFLHFVEPKVCYHVHRSLLLIPMLGLISVVSALTSKHRSSKWSLAYRFQHQTLYALLFSPMHATRPTHSVILDLITGIMVGEQYKSEVPHFAVFSSLLLFLPC